MILAGLPQGREVELRQGGLFRAGFPTRPSEDFFLPSRAHYADSTRRSDPGRSSATPRRASSHRRHPLVSGDRACVAVRDGDSGGLSPRGERAPARDPGRRLRARLPRAGGRSGCGAGVRRVGLARLAGDEGIASAPGGPEPGRRGNGSRGGRGPAGRPPGTRRAMYPVQSVAVERAWYFTLPSGSIEVREAT